LCINLSEDALISFISPTARHRKFAAKLRQQVIGIVHRPASDNRKDKD
jgi:hypothetical protein